MLPAVRTPGRASRGSTAILSWAEICARHPDEWVVLVDVVQGRKSGEIRRARVLGHGVDRKLTLPRVNPVGAGYREFEYRYAGGLKALPAGWPLRWQ